jgi:hypothetical protein
VARRYRDEATEDTREVMREQVVNKRVALMQSLAVFAFSVRALLPCDAFAQAADVPYVPTPMIVVEAMLNIANVGPNDFVIDLGSGDGRIVITAAKKYGARGFGVDLDGALVSQARRDAARQGVADRVEFHARNLFITDIDKATVLTSYLFPRVNMQLRPRIFSELRPGTRVVSHEFDFGNWRPDAQLHVAVPEKRYGSPASEVYLWIVPANAAGNWQWGSTIGGSLIECELTLDQTFQMLQGSALAGGKPARVESAKLNGHEIVVVLVAEVNGQALRQEFSGRIEGDTIRGRSRSAGGDTEWQATRVVRGKINIDA